MAQQDDVIIIRTTEEVTTSILDYFLNIALVTEISEDDLILGQSFSASGLEEYASLSAVAEKFVTTSNIYKIARDVFNQKTNIGINQSNMRRLVIIKKEEGDVSFEACLTRVGYKNSYFVLTNPKTDDDIESVNNWVSTYRKMQFAQTNTADVKTDGVDDVGAKLKAKKAGRTALYYHSILEENLAGAMASILSAYPIGRKNASYKQPTGITVDTLKDSEEANLKNKNVNFYVPFIGGAGDYSTRYLTSDNGTVSSGDEIQKIIVVDRTVLSLQASLMDGLVQDLPYDDDGATIMYDKVNDVFKQLKKEKLFSADYVDSETGELVKSYTIKSLSPRGEIKKNYPDYFAQKMFIIEATVALAGSGKKVMITLAH